MLLAGLDHLWLPWRCSDVAGLPQGSVAATVPGRLSGQDGAAQLLAGAVLIPLPGLLENKETQVLGLCGM